MVAPVESAGDAVGVARVESPSGPLWSYWWSQPRSSSIPCERSYSTPPCDAVEFTPAHTPMAADLECGELFVPDKPPHRLDVDSQDLSDFVGEQEVACACN